MQVTIALCYELHVTFRGNLFIAPIVAPKRHFHTEIYRPLTYSLIPRLFTGKMRTLGKSLGMKLLLMYMHQLGQWRSYIYTSTAVIVVLVCIITMPSELVGHGFTYRFLSFFDCVVVGSEAVPLGREAWSKLFWNQGKWRCILLPGYLY